jgi:diguanylate cyclase (GGDEF)-like protein/PAS domain S-box-containing protein
VPAVSALTDPERLALFEAVVVQASDAVVITRRREGGRTRRVAYVNAAFSELTGYQLDEVIGRRPGFLRSPGTDPGLDGEINKRVDAGEAVSVETVLERRDGTPFWAVVTHFRVEVAGGEPATVSVYRDVSDRVREEHRFRSLIEHVSDVVAVVDEDLTFSFVSPAMRTVLGWEPSALIGRPVADIVVRDLHPDFDDVVSDVAATPGPHGPFGVNLRTADESVRFLQVVIANRLDDPTVGGLVLSARDETDRHEAEERLKRSEAWSQTLVRHGFDLILLIDGDGKISWASPSSATVLGSPAEDLVGRNCFDLVHLDDVDFARFEVASATRNGPVARRSARWRMAHNDGSLRFLDVFSHDLSTDPDVHGIVINAHDVTDQVEAANALRQSERRFRALVQNSSDVIVLVCPDGSVSYSSPAVTEVLGLPELAAGDTDGLFDRVHPDDQPLARRALRAAMSTPGRTGPLEVRVWAGGRWRNLEMLGTNLVDDPDVGGIVFNGRDVTDRRRAEDLVRDQATVLEGVARGLPLATTVERATAFIEDRLPGSGAAVSVLDPDGVLRHPFATSLPGPLIAALNTSLPEAEIGLAVRSPEPALFPDVATDRRWDALLPAVEAAGFRACWCYPMTAPGTGANLGIVTVFVPEARCPEPAEVEILERARDLAAIAVERRRFEERLEHLAVADELTGLPNRTLLLDRVSQALARGHRHGADVAVLLVDLDQFKRINDSLGHAAGDLLLGQVAERFIAAVRPGDTVGRFGGDEFLVVCEQVGGEIGAVAVAEAMAAALLEPFDLSGDEVVVTASVGITLAEDAGADPEALIRDADAAMYRAKEQGRAGHAVFEEALHEQVVLRLDLERALRAALADEQLVVHYQPVVRVVDGALVAAEALVRWNRPGHGLVVPDLFVPVAEETGLIVPIDRWVLRQACAQVAAWRATDGMADMRVTVNVSARQLSDADLPAVVAAALADHDLPPSALGLELTESALVSDLDVAVAALDALHDLGVGVAIDDFGTGYSSLDYVRRFAMADQLKIDRSFVADLESRAARDQAICSASLVLARDLGFTSVAEGVETNNQLEALTALGCDLAQGFLFCPPVRPDELVQWAEARSGA